MGQGLSGECWPGVGELDPWGKGRESALDLEGVVPVGAGTAAPMCPQEESPVGFQTGVESQHCPRLGWYLPELGLEPGLVWKEADPHSLTRAWDPAHSLLSTLAFSL